MPRRWLGLLGSTAVLLVALAAWWLHAEAAPRNGDTAAMPAARAPADDAAFHAPAAVIAQPVPLPDALAESDGSPDALAATVEDAAALGDISRQPVLVHGRVLDAHGAPLPGALVVYWPAPSSLDLYGLMAMSCGPALDVLPRTVSDGGGWFTLQGVAFRGPVDPDAWDWVRKQQAEQDAAEVRVAVLADGLATRSRTATRPQDAPCEAGDIALEPGGWLAGRVLDERGVPLAGVEVACRGPSAEPRVVEIAPTDAGFAAASAPFGSVITGSDGRFRTGPLWEGSISLRAHAAGLLPGWVRSERVTAGVVRDVGDLTLLPSLALTGQVLDAARAPVAGANVAAVADPGSASSMMIGDGVNQDTVPREALAAVQDGCVTTDADGGFTLPDLRRVSYRLYVVAEGFEPLRAEDVQPGGLPVTLVIERQATLRLRVVSAGDGQPVTDAEVLVERGGHRPYFPGTPLAVVAGPEPGTWDATGVNATALEVTVTAPGRTEHFATLQGIAPPGSVERRLELPRESLVTGQVRDAAGAPLAGATVQVMRPPDVSSFEAGPVVPSSKATTDGDGRYALHGLPAGSFTLRAEGAEVAPAPRVAPAEQAITLLAETPLSEVDFVLARTASVSGVVRYSDDSVAAKLELYVTRTDASGAKKESERTVTDSDGGFAFASLAAGAWHMSRVPDQRFTLEPGEHRQLELRVPAPTRIEGIVRDDLGAPVPLAVVSLVQRRADGSAAPHQVACCDSDGRFRMDCDPGSVSLLATSRDGRLSAVTDAVAAASATTSVNLQLGSERAEVHLVDAATREPVAGVRVTLFPLLEDGKPALTRRPAPGDTHLDPAMLSDDRGVARFVGIAPGRFQVEVRGDVLLASPAAPLTIAAGATPVFEVAVVRSASVRGLVRDAAGVVVEDGCLASLRRPEGAPPLIVRVFGGRCEWSGLAPGTWRLRIERDDKLLSEQSIELAPGQRLELELTVPE